MKNRSPLCQTALIAACVLACPRVDAATKTEPADDARSRPTTQPSARPVRYLGLADGEETSVPLGELGSTVRTSRVEQLTWKEYVDLARQSSQHEFHGKLLYLAVKDFTANNEKAYQLLVPLALFATPPSVPPPGK